MSERDALSLGLPDAPPPRPAQRRAAIDRALARFDGQEAATLASAGGSRGGLRWLWPQFSAAATVVLVGVVSLSLLNSGEYREASLPRRPASAATERTAPSQAPRQALREAVPTAPAAVLPSERVSAAPSAPVVQRPAKAVAPPAALVAEAISRVPGVSYAPAPPAPPPPPAPAPPTQSVDRENVDSIVANDIGALPDAERIVVTGARTQGAAQARSWSDELLPKARGTTDRGDWNACTIDDPARSLSACRMMVDPATPGDEGRADAQIADGLSHAWGEDARGAAAAFDRAIDLTGRSWVAFLNRGLIRERSGNRRGALADLDRAVRLSPRSASAYYHRSLVRERSGDRSGARADARRALALDPAYRAVIR